MIEQVLKKFVGQTRIKHGRNKCVTMGIVDAQSVKNSDSAEQKGYDAGKKVSGIKRYIVVDSQRLPHAWAVTTANVTDRNGAIEALSGNSSSLGNMINLLADGGYTGEPFADRVQQLIGSKVEVVKRNELHRFEVLPKRWIVERSFAWFEKCRRLCKNCERKLNSSLQFMIIAFLRLIIKRS